MKLLATLVLTLALLTPAFAKGKQAAGFQTMDRAALNQHAAETVAALHDEMLDPASFVLDSVFVTKQNKRGNVSLCYTYRSHNRMGGFSQGVAVEDGDDHNRLSTFTVGDDGHTQGFDTGWTAPCKAKNLDREITADVSGAAPGLYRKIALFVILEGVGSSVS
jgi:hypothetical protein